MLRERDILATLRMLREENLDVRAVTLGINLDDCADRNIHTVTRAVRAKIGRVAASLVDVCDDLTATYGIAIVNKRIAVSPVSRLLEGHGGEAAILLGEALDEAAAEVRVDLIGGFTALVHKGITPGERLLIESLPRVLATTQRVCASVNIGTTRAGIQVDAVNLVSATILRIAEASASTQGFGAAKLVVFANAPEDNPFMAGAFLGCGEAESVINVGVSGPGVVKRAIERRLADAPESTLDDLAETVKHTAYRVTRAGELIAREAANRLGIPFGIVDLSLAPTPRVGDSVGEIYQAMGIDKLGAPGTTAAVALLNDAVKKGGAFASSSVGGLSGAFIPVMEDHALSDAVSKGWLTLEKLEAMTAVCSVGLDMILLPGDTSAETIAGLILDEAAIGVTNNKTTAVRVIPVPGKSTGERVDFGGLFGSGTIVNVNCPDGAERFIRRGGRIPAPLRSLGN